MCACVKYLILLSLGISTVILKYYDWSFPFPLQLHDERTVIGKTLFKKETKIQAFLGLKVQLSTGCLPFFVNHCSLPSFIRSEVFFLFISDRKNSRSTIAAFFIA